jgi:hypothetical protein
VLFLDTRHRLIAGEKLLRGTLAQTSVYPREIVKARSSTTRRLLGQGACTYPPMLRGSYWYAPWRPTLSMTLDDSGRGIASESL